MLYKQLNIIQSLILPETVYNTPIINITPIINMLNKFEFSPFQVVRSPPSPSFGPADLFHAFYDTAGIQTALRAQNQLHAQNKFS